MLNPGLDQSVSATAPASSDTSDASSVSNPAPEVAPPLAPPRETPTAISPDSRPTAKVWPGTPYPLGATFDGFGTNFAVFSGAAEKVDLCLFDDAGHETRVPLFQGIGQVWHAYLPNVAPGQRYGIRSFPTVLVINRAGIITFAQSGEVPEDVLASQVQQVLAVK